MSITRMSPHLLLALTLVQLGSATVCGESGSTAKPTPQQLIAQAYRESQQAKTIEEYTLAIEKCEQAREHPLHEDAEQYAQRLLSWLHNKRGEAYSAEAASAAGQADSGAEIAWEKKALADFQQAVAFNAQAWRPRHNRGVSYAILKEYKKALADFNGAIERNPRYKNTWFNRAEVHYELRNYAEAISDYSQTLRLDPQDGEAYSSRGHAYFQSGQIAEAIDDYGEAIRLRPDDADSYVDRADAYCHQDAWGKAAADYRVAIRLNPSLPRAYQNAAWLMATCPDPRFRNPELALRAAQKAIKLSGEPDHQALDTLAAAQAVNGDFDQAHQTVAQAMHLAPEEKSSVLRGRLDLYEKKKTFVQPAGLTAAEEADPPRSANLSTAAASRERSMAREETGSPPPTGRVQAEKTPQNYPE